MKSIVKGTFRYQLSHGQNWPGHLIYIDYVPCKPSSQCIDFSAKTFAIIHIELKARKHCLAGNQNCCKFMNMTAMSNPEKSISRYSSHLWFLYSLCFLFRNVPWALVVVHRINSTKIPDRWGRYPPGPAPSWGVANSFWLLEEEESFSFEYVFTGGLPMLLWVASPPCTHGQHQLDLLGY